MTQPTPVADDGVLATEPVAAFLTGLAGLIDLGLVAASALDLINLTSEQTAAVIAFISAAVGVIGGFLRQKVWSPASVALISKGPVI